MKRNTALKQDNEPAATTAGSKVGSSLLLKQQVIDALSFIPGGAELDKYFGITSGKPVQPEDEAARSEELIRGLRDASEGKTPLPELLQKLALHNAQSQVDPDALRALMRSPVEAGEETSTTIYYSSLG
jgi:hypothetical protein